MKDSAIHDAAERWVRCGDPAAMRMLGIALGDPKRAPTVVRALHFEYTLNAAVAAREARRRSSFASQRFRRPAAAGPTVWILAAASIVLAISISLATAGGSSPPFAEVTSSEGVVTDGDGSSFAPGSALPVGSEVMLQHGHATIHLIVSDAVCELDSGAGGALLKLSTVPRLERGILRVRAGKRAADQALTFRTPHASATVVGTVFSLRVDDDTRLQVEEGSVSFTRLDGTHDLIQAGTSVSARQVGSAPSRPADDMPKAAIAYSFTAKNPLADLSGGGLNLTANSSSVLGTRGLRIFPGDSVTSINQHQGLQAWQSFRDGGGITILADVCFEGAVPSERILMAEVLGFLDADSQDQNAPVQLWYKPGPYAVADRSQRWAVSIYGGFCRTWCDGKLVDQVTSSWTLEHMHPPIHVKLMHLVTPSPTPAAWFARMLVLPVPTSHSGAAFLSLEPSPVGATNTVIQ